MPPTDARLIAHAGGVGASALGWARGWWQVARLSALMLTLALLPSTWTRADRGRVVRHLWLGTAPGLAWFTLLMALSGLVLIRIVTVTAVSYGLTPYALEMVVRVLLLELIPLAAALYVALRYALPQRALLVARHRERAPDLRTDLLPRVVAVLFAVPALAAVSCVVALVLAYVSVFGFTPWGFEVTTRTVGRIFNPALTLVFVLKTLGFALVVALVPAASAVAEPPAAGRTAASAELRTLVRLFALVLVIEMASLMVNYA